MSFWIAGATIGSTIFGAVSSNNAANKIARSNQAGLDATNALSNKARLDAVDLFNQGKRSRMLGQNAAFDFYKQNAQKINQPMIQGNMMAQQTIGQGGIQANNAILGLPVDMSFANNPQQVTTDYSGISNAKLPNIADKYTVQPIENPQQAQQNNSSGGNKNNLARNLLLGGAAVALGGAPALLGFGGKLLRKFHL